MNTYIKFLYIQATSAGSRGDIEGAKKNNMISIGLTAAAIVSAVVGIIVIIAAAAGSVASAGAAVTRLGSSSRCSSFYSSFC